MGVKAHAELKDSSEGQFTERLSFEKKTKTSTYLCHTGKMVRESHPPH